MYIKDAELAGTTRFLSYSEVYVIAGLVISRDNLYSKNVKAALLATQARPEKRRQIRANRTRTANCEISAALTLMETTQENGRRAWQHVGMTTRKYDYWQRT